jgi:hypothetical protein
MKGGDRDIAPPRPFDLAERSRAMTGLTTATCRIGAGFLAAGLTVLAGCETAFVGEAPSGRYELVRVEGRALPFERDRGACRKTVSGGHFELDSIARRFVLDLRAVNSCGGSGTVRETGSYLRRGGTLNLETEGATPRRITARESGRTVSLAHDGLDLRFTRSRPR